MKKHYIITREVREYCYVTVEEDDDTTEDQLRDKLYQASLKESWDHEDLVFWDYEPDGID